mmetsp:Transcript_14914/g.20214  ORF Transcript_14914/g.20214 Transcript_14914/m.20214 type:complete len:100 (+) Transcript_14914:944-1243(+)
MKNFYPDLKMLGKHYLLRAVDSDLNQQGSARQYTVASTMEPSLYNSLVKGLTQADASSQDEILGALTQNQASAELSLTIKSYQVGGLSQAIHAGSSTFL